MKRNMGGTRRAFLRFLGALPMSLLGVRSEAQSRQLELLSYSLGATPARAFASKVATSSTFSHATLPTTAARKAISRSAR